MKNGINRPRSIRVRTVIVYKHFLEKLEPKPQNSFRAKKVLERPFFVKNQTSFGILRCIHDASSIQLNSS